MLKTGILNPQLNSLQESLATHKAHKQDTRSVRRLLKRLGRKQRNRTRSFCQQTAAKLVQWAPADSVLVFERLTLPQTSEEAASAKGYAPTTQPVAAPLDAPKRHERC